MEIKKRIQKDFIDAMKKKDLVRKSTLSGIKAKITEAEKVKNQGDLSDEEITKVLLTAAKQRKQSIESFQNGGRKELADSERAELKILEEYLPQQMSKEEIAKELAYIITEMNYSEGGNKQKMIGQTIGAFNKKFAGKADIGKVRILIESLLG